MFRCALEEQVRDFFYSQQRMMFESRSLPITIGTSQSCRLLFHFSVDTFCMMDAFAVTSHTHTTQRERKHERFYRQNKSHAISGVRRFARQSGPRAASTDSAWFKEAGDAIRKYAEAPKMGLLLERAKGENTEARERSDLESAAQQSRTRRGKQKETNGWTASCERQRSTGRP